MAYDGWGKAREMTHQLHFKDELVPQAGAKRRQHSVFVHGLDKACCVQGTESRSLGLEHRVYGGWEEGSKRLECSTQNLNRMNWALEEWRWKSLRYSQICA